MNNRIILAPLKGITPAIYRSCYKRHFDGISEAMAPFITTLKEKKVNSKIVRDILPEYNIDGYEMTPQILGNNPDDIDSLLENLIKLGFKEVNWNLGCPAPMIVKKNRGSGLLPFPEIINTYLEKLNSFSEINYTVKTRLGLFNNRDIFNILPMLKEHNCKELILHPRTGEQIYRGFADIDSFEEIYKNSDIPMVYNGDIQLSNQVENIKNRFPNISGIMIGRGLIMNPFLPEDIVGTSLNSESEDKRLYNFMVDLVNSYSDAYSGDRPVLGKMKEIWSYLALNFPDSKKGYKKILKSLTLDKYLIAVDSFFENYSFSPVKEVLNLSNISGLH